MSTRVRKSLASLLPLTCCLLLVAPLLAQNETQEPTIVQRTITSQTPQSYQVPTPQPIQVQPPIQVLPPIQVPQTYQVPTTYQGQLRQGYSTQVPQAPVSQSYQTETNTNFNPNAQLVGQLQGILAQQAQIGQFPSNNQLLNSLQNLVNQYSQPVQPPQSPLVGVTNQGPGNLRILKPNQFPMDIGPNSSVDVIAGDPVTLEAVSQDTNILVTNRQSGIVKFWDVDDNAFTYIRQNESKSYNLGRGIKGYTLQKN